MPSIVCQSKVRAVSDHCSLTLAVQHRLLAGKTSHPVVKLKEARFPDDVDILLTSNLAITLSGDLDGEPISSEDMYASELAQHLVDYLSLNASELRLNSVSKLERDDNTNVIQVILTPSRQPPTNRETVPIHVLLVAIDLCYSWRIPCSADKPDRTSHPFTHRLSLPYKTVLDNVIGRFVTWQLVKRYPLIFGPWCKQLDLDASYFRGVANSILRIIQRSQSKAFRARCKRYIQVIHSQRIKARQSASRSLSAFICSSDSENEEVSFPDINDQDLLCYALEKIYRDGMARPQFKGLSSTPCADTADDEDLCKHSDRETQPPDLMQMTETFVWDEIFKNPIIAKTARPSSNSAVDSYDILETLSDGENGPHVDTDIVDNQDILQEEDWHDCELPNPESNLDFTFKRFSPGALTLNPFPDVESAAASSVLNLDDPDDKMSFSESQATSQDEHIELMFGNDFHTLAGHDVGEALTQDSDSEDEALGISHISQSTLAQTSLGFSISKTHPICLAEYSQDSALETGYHGETEGYTCQLANCASLQEEDDDLDLGLTFEKPCNNSGLLIHLSFDDYEASESGGDSVDFAAMHVPLEGIFSHHVATLDITWPPQAQNEYHLSHPLSRFVDNDEEMWLVE